MTVSLKDKDLRQKVGAAKAVGQVDGAQYDAVFLAGGWGAAFDFEQSPELGQLLLQAERCERSDRGRLPRSAGFARGEAWQRPAACKWALTDGCDGQAGEGTGHYSTRRVIRSVICAPQAAGSSYRPDSGTSLQAM